MSDETKQYWDDDKVESMYDKNLVEIETAAILEYLEVSDRLIDIGCGEGEGTVKYYEKVREIIGVDYSQTRLEKLRAKNKKIATLQMDMKDLSFDRVGSRVTKAITQRSLINLKNFDEQKNVIARIHSLLDDSGKYLMLEGFNEGGERINRMRTDFGLPRIGVKWHNCFFNKTELLKFLEPYFDLEFTRDFSAYFFMTRVFNAVLKHPDIPQWDDPINRLAKTIEINYKNQFMSGISRLELLVLRKKPDGR